MSLAGDVVAWIDELGADRAHVIGHDWGAVLTYVVAANQPDRVRTATALAIPPLTRIPEAVRRVPRQLVRSWYMTFFQLPGVAERSLRADDWRLLRRLWSVWSPGYELPPDDWSTLTAAFGAAGRGVECARLLPAERDAAPAARPEADPGHGGDNGAGANADPQRDRRRVHGSASVPPRPSAPGTFRPGSSTSRWPMPGTSCISNGPTWSTKPSSSTCRRVDTNAPDRTG